MKELIPPIESPDGLFHDGNPLTGELGTIVPAKWLNDMQGATQATQSEIITVLEASGLRADLDKKDQLLTAITYIIRQSAFILPIGVPIPYPLAIPPLGYLKCNGAPFNESSYPALAALYPSGKLPDLRGEFIRGWDDGRGVDSERLLLSGQLYSVEPHTHNTKSAQGLISAGNSNYLIPINSSVGSFAATDANDSSGNETRPRNIAFNYIVRAA